MGVGMLPFFSRKSLKKSQLPTTDMVVKNASDLAVPVSEYGLVGLQEALSLESNIFSQPEVSLSNAIVGVQMVANGTSAVTSFLDDSNTAMNQTQLISTSLIWGLSNGAQLLKYYNGFSRLRESTEELIKNLPIDLISNCYSINKGKEEVLSTISNSDDIIGFLKINGKITITFTVSAKTIDLYDFGIFTSRVGRTAAFAGACALLAELINISYYFASESSNSAVEGHATTLSLLSGFATNVPLIDIANKLSSACNNHTKHFIEALNTVVTELYVNTKQLHIIPERLLEVVSRFVSTEDMIVNRERIRAYTDTERGLVHRHPRLVN